MKLTTLLAAVAAISLVALVLSLTFEFHTGDCYAAFAVGMALVIFLRDYTRQRIQYRMRLAPAFRTSRIQYR